MIALTWATAVASLLGVWLNIHRKVACFWIWAITNGIWVYIDVLYQIWAQAFLQAVYFGLAIYGILHWSGQSQEEPR